MSNNEFTGWKFAIRKRAEESRGVDVPLIDYGIW
jgi:hypothetical protein